MSRVSHRVARLETIDVIGVKRSAVWLAVLRALAPKQGSLPCHLTTLLSNRLFNRPTRPACVPVSGGAR